MPRRSGIAGTRLLAPTAPLCIRAFRPARSVSVWVTLLHLVRECTSRHGPPRHEIRRHIRRQYRSHPQCRAACESARSMPAMNVAVVVSAMAGKDQ